MSLTLNLPINQVSFGQVSIGIMRELFNRNTKALWYPCHNQFDLSSEKDSEAFERWLKYCVTNFHVKHNRDNKSFKLWHLNGGMESITKDQVLLSFYELDEPTPAEVNVVKNNYKVLFSNQEAVDIFKNKGCDNVGYIPLGFDSENFKKVNREVEEDKVIFSVVGKFEKRKHHEKVIKAWLKKYGDDKRYALHCAVWNPFMSQEQNESIVQNLLEGKRYFNIVFNGFMQSNEQYNHFLNSSDVVLGMSGGEGWGLPEFQSVCVGKHAVILNCCGYKSWATEENSVLVEPKGKIKAYDGMFFNEKADWNQGSIHDFSEDDFIDGCEKVIKKVEASRENAQGLKLAEEFSYSKMVDQIIKETE